VTIKGQSSVYDISTKRFVTRSFYLPRYYMDVYKYIYSACVIYSAYTSGYIYIREIVPV